MYLDELDLHVGGRLVTLARELDAAASALDVIARALGGTVDLVRWRSGAARVAMGEVEDVTTDLRGCARRFSELADVAAAVSAGSSGSAGSAGWAVTVGAGGAHD